jgi:hypothetical protein
MTTRWAVVTMAANRKSLAPRSNTDRSGWSRSRPDTPSPSEERSTDLGIHRQLHSAQHARLVVVGISAISTTAQATTATPAISKSTMTMRAATISTAPIIGTMDGLSSLFKAPRVLSPRCQRSNREPDHLSPEPCHRARTFTKARAYARRFSRGFLSERILRVGKT